MGRNEDKSAIRTMPKDWIAYIESEEYKIKINNFMSYFELIYQKIVLFF